MTVRSEIVQSMAAEVGLPPEQFAKALAEEQVKLGRTGALSVEPEKCPDCGTATFAVHRDGSQTCGHCYMQRARDLGVIR